MDASTSLFALVVCINYYVSCEGVFELKLNGKAVVVISNNDGCVVARSMEYGGEHAHNKNCPQHQVAGSEELFIPTIRRKK